MGDYGNIGMFYYLTLTSNKHNKSVVFFAFGGRTFAEYIFTMEIFWSGVE